MKLSTLLFFLPALILAQEWSNFKWHLNPNISQVTVDIDDLHFYQKQSHSNIQLDFSLLNHLKPKKEIKVAVIDGGVDYHHPSLTQFMNYKLSECFDQTIIPEMKVDQDDNGYQGDCLGFNFFGNNNLPNDDDGHGTHVAGLITEPFIINRSSHLKIVPLKIFDESKQKQPNLRSLIHQSLEYALKENVDIIHLSMGWPHSLHTAKIDQVIKKAIEQGVLIVSSAGNSNQHASIYPCQIEKVVCIGGLSIDGKKALFSNHGKNVDFYLPGEKILSTVPENILSSQLGVKGVDFKSGTSQAAPLFTGIIAYLKSSYPHYSWKSFLMKLKQNMFFDSTEQYQINLSGIIQQLEHKVDSTPIQPLLKKIQVIQKQDNILINVPFKKLNSFQHQVNLKLECNQRSQEQTIDSTQKEIIFSLKKLSINLNQLNCHLSINAGILSYRFTLPLYHKISHTKAYSLPPELESQIIKTRRGVAVKLYSIAPLAQLEKKAYFFSSHNKKIQFYYLNKLINEISISKDCRVLRIWQYNQENDDQLILEKLCHKKYIAYDFYQPGKKEKLYQIKFFPQNTIVHYDSLKVIKSHNQLIFEYLSPSKLDFKTKTEFVRIKLPSQRRLVTLTANLADKEIKFKEEFIDDIDQWRRSLGIRYIPNYRVVIRTSDKILIEINQKFAIIHRKTKHAQWVPWLDHYLLGSPHKKMTNSKIILSELITPYDFQYMVLDKNSFKLVKEGSYHQDNLEDPLMGSFTNYANNQINIALKSYYHLLYLENSPELKIRSKLTVDRFDFLGGVEQQSLLSSLNNNSLKFIVDGSSVHENYFSFYQNQKRVDYKIDKNCRSLSLIQLKRKAYLPMICLDKKLKLIPLE